MSDHRVLGNRLLVKRYEPMDLLYDQFLTQEAAPIAIPRTCEPGPGTLTWKVDPNDRISIDGEQTLVCNAAGTDNPQVRSGSIARQEGLIYQYRATLQTDPPANLEISPHACWRGTSIYGAYTCTHGVLLSGLTVGNGYTFRTILHPIGHHLYYWTGAWSLIHNCDESTADRAIGLRWLDGNAAACRIDYIFVIK